MEQHNFWKCISILLKNYHAVNKKMFACKIKAAQKVISGVGTFKAEQLEVNFDHGTLNIGSGKLDVSPSHEYEILSTLSSADHLNHCNGFIMSLTFMTKKDEETIKGVGFIDFVNTQYICTFQSKTFDDFQIALISGELVINTLTNRREDAEVNRWADFVLKPKLVKWSMSVAKKEHVVDSLHIIDVELYSRLYQKMKEKYSKSLIAIWEESTDPLKYVYEDLAIAAYLICLWKEHHCVPTGFADLGCGNGLLVFILNQEGFRGRGYDVRSRKIWSLYPTTTLLFEETIKPDRFKLPPEIDWVIGNHSDELSPWIPVIAAHGSIKMKYFMLPCCQFEFSGMKFQRRNSKLSSYNDFLNYLEMVSKKCGFLTLRDRLKIPSTKRIALIGIARTYAEKNHTQICSEVQEFLVSELKNNRMKLRRKEEIVRNCTQINSDILDGLVKKIFLRLLGPETQQNTSTWNEGSTCTIKEIAEYLSPENKKSIKSECGGLKTLFKNKHEIFEICPGDAIRIRRPKPRDINNTKLITMKKRPCFFATNHPNGCPLADADCTFIHA